jgi:hypothetical protein
MDRAFDGLRGYNQLIQTRENWFKKDWFRVTPSR